MGRLANDFTNDTWIVSRVTTTIVVLGYFISNTIVYVSNIRTRLENIDRSSHVGRLFQLSSSPIVFTGGNWPKVDIHWWISHLGIIRPSPGNFSAARKNWTHCPYHIAKDCSYLSNTKLDRIRLKLYNAMKMWLIGRNNKREKSLREYMTSWNIMITCLEMERELLTNHKAIATALEMTPPKWHSMHICLR